MLSSELLNTFDAILRSGEYNETANTIYEFRILNDASRENSVTMQWDQRRGLQPAPRQTPTCTVEFDFPESFRKLVTRDKQILDLLGTRQIRIGGLFDDAADFARLFQTTIQIPREHRLITLPPIQKQEARAESLDRIRSIDLNGAETGRIARTLDNFVNHRIDECVPDAIVEMDVPGLAVRPWLEAADLELSQVFQDSFSDLRNEALTLISGNVLAPQYGGRVDSPDQTAAGRPFGWRHWRIVSLFRSLSEMAERTPVAAAVVREISRKYLVVAAEYLILEPGVHIYPHADGLSWGVSVNCGLVVPEGCYLTVAGETRLHKERQLLVFNDGFIHSAGNTSGMPRVLFNAMCTNPAFTRKEQMALKIVAQTLNSKL